MSLHTTFQNAAKTIFNVFKSLIIKADYVDIEKDGFDVNNETLYPVDVIIDNFAERDVQFLSFSNLIQPTDVKGLVRGKQLLDQGLTFPSTQDVLRVSDGREFSIVAHATDPARAMYTFLLRKI